MTPAFGREWEGVRLDEVGEKGGRVERETEDETHLEGGNILPC
jgi:hypothetical protein